MQLAPSPMTLVGSSQSPASPCGARMLAATGNLRAFLWISVYECGTLLQWLGRLLGLRFCQVRADTHHGHVCMRVDLRPSPVSPTNLVHVRYGERSEHHSDALLLRDLALSPPLTTSFQQCQLRRRPTPHSDEQRPPLCAKRQRPPLG